MKKFILAGLSFAIIVTLVACSGLDVIGNTSITSFKAVLEAMPDSITADEMNGGWSLAAPDGSARFIWSKDFSKSALHDVMLEFEAQPFIDAGLDVSKLPQGMAFDDMIMVGTKLGEETLIYDKEATPIASYEQIVRLKRDSISYHTSLDHFGVKLGDGSMFEWAKDMSTNAKDIVFVLNPQPFIDAGVDPSKVQGWVFAKVETMDANGKKVEVDKLLKPFDIK